MKKQPINADHPFDPFRFKSLELIEEVPDLTRAQAMDRILLYTGKINEAEVLDQKPKRVLVRGGMLKHAGKDEEGRKDRWSIEWEIHLLHEAFPITKDDHTAETDLGFLESLPKKEEAE